MRIIPEWLSAWLGGRLSAYLSATRHVHSASAPVEPAMLLRTLRPGDVLLVEGQSRVSAAIKYLTQSTWSHAALFTGDLHGLFDPRGGAACFIEADIQDGVRAVGVVEFEGLHCRICRPVGLNAEDTSAVIEYAKSRLGHHYDMKNVVDLARYLLPTPPVPTHWRRRMIAFGSGDPSRAICSTLVAQAFQSVRYPILPLVTTLASPTAHCPDCVQEILHIRHHSLFVPRDFDVSPYFQVVKPSIEAGFDHRALVWADRPAAALSEQSA